MKFKVLILIVASFLNLVVKADTLSDEIKISNKTAYFQDSLSSLRKEFVSYAQAPVGENSLDPNEYPRVIEVFEWWTKNVIKAEYLPDYEFISKNLKLIPANDRRKEDIAYLSYCKDQADFMIVQTGGIGEKIGIFISANNRISSGKDEEIKTIAVSAIQKYLNISSSTSIPGLNVSKHGNLYYTDARFSPENQNILRLFKSVISEKEISLFLKKEMFGKPGPANLPLPNSWFKWEKKIQDTRKQ